MLGAMTLMLQRVVENLAPDWPISTTRSRRRGSIGCYLQRVVDLFELRLAYARRNPAVRSVHIGLPYPRLAGHAAVR